MARLTCASPGAPPPSLILRRLEPGPIGSVARFARRSWPGSTRIRVQAGAGAARAPRRRAAGSTSRAYRVKNMPAHAPRDSTIAVVGDGFGSLLVSSTAQYVGFSRDAITIYGTSPRAVGTYL